VTHVGDNLEDIEGPLGAIAPVWVDRFGSPPGAEGRPKIADLRIAPVALRASLATGKAGQRKRAQAVATV
jgi:hypothetical protein